MILTSPRDPRLVTLRRGGTLTDEHHRLLALWAVACAQHVLRWSNGKARTPARAPPLPWPAPGPAGRRP